MSDSAKVVVVARITVKEGYVDAVLPELIKMVDPTRLEDGCISYELHRDNDDSTVFIFVETWESISHLEAHMDTEHFRAYVAAVGDFIQSKVVHKLTKIR